VATGTLSAVTEVWSMTASSSTTFPNQNPEVLFKLLRKIGRETCASAVLHN